jgi:hypothetical protein
VKAGLLFYAQVFGIGENCVPHSSRFCLMR